MSLPKRGRGQVSGEYRKFGRDVIGNWKGMASFSSDPEKWMRSLFGVKTKVTWTLFLWLQFFLKFCKNIGSLYAPELCMTYSNIFVV